MLIIEIMGTNSGYIELPKEAVKAKSFECIKKAKRLFYHEVSSGKPTGLWIEIFDVNRFVEQDQYHQDNNIKYNCSYQSYLHHHNFHVIL